MRGWTVVMHDRQVLRSRIGARLEMCDGRWGRRGGKEGRRASDMHATLSTLGFS